MIPFFESLVYNKVAFESQKNSISYLHWFCVQMLSDLLQEVTKSVVEYRTSPRLSEVVIEVWYELVLISLQHIVQVSLVDVVQAQIVVHLLEGGGAQSHYLVYQAIHVEVKVHVAILCVCA